MARVGISGGILAGGAGTRFGGVDKGWVEFEGRPLIAWVLDVLRPQVDEVLISANRNRERYAALGATVLADASPETFDGPLAGLVQLLSAARHDWLLCVPCDALTLPADLAARFAARVDAEAADIAVLTDGEGMHPTFCLVRTSLADDARQAYAAGERALRGWFARHRVVRVEGSPPLNLNTPGSLAGVKLRS
jgi:molybdopterin-guanine dinucleotide biosynthesis protein A